MRFIPEGADRASVIGIAPDDTEECDDAAIAGTHDLLEVVWINRFVNDAMQRPNPLLLP